jgi:hypothetical protein
MDGLALERRAPFEHLVELLSRGCELEAELRGGRDSGTGREVFRRTV